MTVQLVTRTDMEKMSHKLDYITKLIEKNSQQLQEAADENDSNGYKLISREKTRQLLGEVSYKTVEQLEKKGSLTPVRLYDKGKVFYRATELEDFVNSL